MKKWEIQSNFKFQISDRKAMTVFKLEKLTEILLQNRGIKTKRETNEFLNPRLEDITIQNVGINKSKLQKALKRIGKAIKNKEQIVVFGDYDVDGVCGAAILWETLNSLGAKVWPYIPHRIEEGYGLSVKGISNVKLQIPNVKLIITVDNGIVATSAVDFANEQGTDIIITDHHIPSKKLPKALAIVHTTKLCGAAVAWMLAQEIVRGPATRFPPESSRSRNTDLRAVGSPSSRVTPHLDHLELVALASIADLVPLIGPSRTLTKYGLEDLRKTKRLGLLELFKKAALNKESIGTYEVGHIIAPRLNAMGRIESAMDSLRLICTKSKIRADDLAYKLSSTNTERQQVTESALMHALSEIQNRRDLGRLLFVAHESYQQGVIGLVAGKLVEQYYLPSIVVSIGSTYSKASARSISGFNIIEFIRSASNLLVDAGGHPMAAGFTVETAKLMLLQKKLAGMAKKKVDKKLLSRTLRIDCELLLELVNQDLYEEIKRFEPFGMGNPTPTFMSKNVVIEDMRVVGNDQKHIRFLFRIQNSELRIMGIWFGGGERASEFHIGDKVDIAYTVEQDSWNGNNRLQLKIKDLKPI